ncbi:MAG: hypothetical protein Athens101428_531 [Candidatus Berkelbacteria bacterium Athens1014_28]|uniref:Uncharacterized protein n=1 Tax=Candidatus Berkelbacteria bacterium Athens1014_28 TaxID=2017145 RepID=A0A554LMD4_9BACT|nr:MAG: hypothetical protein Athens101428_531 [Candidatus Berkelbacteria bacterium Athens1014_28]
MVNKFLYDLRRSLNILQNLLLDLCSLSLISFGTDSQILTDDLHFICPPIAWSRNRDSNPGPLLYESIALPTKLFRLLERVMGFEPTTSSLPVLRRSRWSSRPDSNRRSSPWEGDILPAELLLQLLLRRMEEGRILPARNATHSVAGGPLNYTRKYTSMLANFSYLLNIILVIR